MPAIQLQQVVAEANRCLTSQSSEDIAKAPELFELLLDVEPLNASVLHALGTSYMRAKRYSLAELVFRYSLTLQPDRLEVLSNLGVTLINQGRHAEAREQFAKAYALSPDLLETQINMMTAYVNNGTPEECLKWVYKILDKYPDNRDALWNGALAQLELYNFSDGWDWYASGLVPCLNSTQTRKRRHYHEKDKVPLWNGAAGPVTVIYGEQGVGDEIMGASMLPDAAERTPIIFEAHPRLANIFRHSFGEKFPIYGTRKVPWNENLFTQWHSVEAQLPLLGLGQFFRRRAEDFPRTPYLKPYPKLVEKYKRRLTALSDKPKIGISWKGGTIHTRNDLRSIPLQHWIPIFQGVDAEWISLQYDPAEAYGWNTPIVESFCNETGMLLHHWPEVINDLDEGYGGLINALDLVVTVHQSLIHACGAFGVPCWVLTPKRCAWPFGVRGTQVVWYGDHVRQMRQEEDDWTPTLNALKQQLIRFCKERRSSALTAA